MGNSLSEFLRSRKQHTQATTIDWEAKRVRWIKALDGLYGRISDMLRDEIDGNIVQVRTFDMSLTEPYLGTYSAPALELSVGTDRVQFLPKGVTVVGASGRVDLRGDRGAVTLLWEGEGKWTVILQRVPDFESASLAPDSLRNALAKVMLPIP